MLETLTHLQFEPLIGSDFELERPGAEPLVLRLVSVELLRTRNGAPRHPFSLLFRGPRNPVMPQQVHPLSHPALATLSIFLVPIENTAEGVGYEAIFN